MITIADRSEQSIQALVTELTEDKVAIARVFLRMVGDVKGALLLSQIIYWSKRTTDPEHWFYKAAEEWHTEICLTRTEIARVLRLLAPLGVETKRKRVNGAVIQHYRINWTTLLDAIFTFYDIQEGRTSGGQPTDRRELTRGAGPIRRFPEDQGTRKSGNVQPDLQDSATSLKEQRLPTEITDDDDAAAQRNGLQREANRMRASRSEHPPIPAASALDRDMTPFKATAHAVFGTALTGWQVAAAHLGDVSIAEFRLACERAATHAETPVRSARYILRVVETMRLEGAAGMALPPPDQRKDPADDDQPVQPRRLKLSQIVAD